MNRTLKCVRFEISRLIGSVLAFILIYAAAYLFLVVLLSSSTDGDSTTNMNIFFAAGIFLFVCLVSLYTNYYNNLMIFGTTRKTILISLFITSGLLAAVMALFSVLSDSLNTALGETLRFESTSFLTTIYGNHNVLESFLFYFTCMLAGCAFALLYGALDYKVGKAFRAIFWVLFGVMWFVVPLLQYLNALSFLFDAVKWYFGYQIQNGLAHTSLHFSVTALLLGAATYLIARRQPQRD